MTGFNNAWLLGVPFILPAFFVGAARKDIAKRMSDMTGYSTGEKAFTIAASIAPYPFLVATFYTPFTSLKPLFYCGIALYGIGIAAFYAAIWVIANTSPDGLFSVGVYRHSRNPMYVAASLVLFSICLVTANLLLFVYFIVLLILQHFMILAEERTCLQKYGALYQEYRDGTPRYLLF